MMTKEQIESIQRSGGVVKELTDLAILGTIIRDVWFSEYFQPSNIVIRDAHAALLEAKDKWLTDAHESDRERLCAIGHRLEGKSPWV